MNRTREQVYEYLRHLDYYSIINLCRSDRYYWNLCHTEIFKKLISDRYRETTEYKVKQLEQKISTLGKNEWLEYIFIPQQHFIRIFNNQIHEFDTGYFLNHDYKNYLLFKLLDQETGFSQLSPQDLIDYAQVLNREGQDMNVDKLNMYGPFILFNYWIEDHNVNYDSDISGNRLTIINPTSKQLREVLTMILEKLGNNVEYIHFFPF